MTRRAAGRNSRRAARNGFTVLEVAVALLIVSTVLVSLTGAFLGTAGAVQNARGMGRGTVFLESVMKDLDAQPYDALADVHGNRSFNRDTAQASHWSVDLSVYPVGVDLLQVDATLVDLRMGQAFAQLSTFRSRR